jgi:hypothetical protein
MAAWKGPGSILDLLGLRVGTVEGQSERARHYTHDDRVAQPAFAFGTGTAYGALVYSRTAAILETLRRVYGDAPMQRAMAVYTRRFRFAHPVPDDLLTTFRAEMGAPAADLLRAALFEKGWIDLAVTAIASHAAHPPAGIFDVGGKRETVTSERGAATRYQGWALITRRGTLTVPVEIELVAEDGTRTRVPWDGVAESIRVPYAGSSPLRSAVVDPDRKVLLDQNPENDFASAAGHSGGGAPRTLERSTYWAELVLGAIAP